jgi:hypothetical protein
MRTTGEAIGPLPDFIVIGAMRCGTTALHRYLDCHPAVHMSHPKELNFFFDQRPGTAGEVDADWGPGNWHRGIDWYRRHFDRAAELNGETSPGYTSPDHPEVAGRMATIVPNALLIYLVRDPVQRAVSQYQFHLRQGTEHRPIETALLDPSSQYIARSRYFERLEPFPRTYGRPRLIVLEQEELLLEHPRLMRGLFTELGLDPQQWRPPLPMASPPLRSDLPLSSTLFAQLKEALRDDAGRLRLYTGRCFSHWCL